MKTVIDHQVTGKSKMIRGRGRKKETPLSEFEDVKTNAYDNRVDGKYLKDNIDAKDIEKNNSKIAKKDKPKSKLNKKFTKGKGKVNKHLSAIKQIILSNNGCLDKKDIIDKLDEIKKICMN